MAESTNKEQTIFCNDPKFLLKPKITRENVLQVFHGRGQLTVLNDSVLHIFQVLYGVDALLPVFAHISQRVLDIFDVHQGTV